MLYLFKIFTNAFFSYLTNKNYYWHYIIWSPIRRSNHASVSKMNSPLWSPLGSLWTLEWLACPWCHWGLHSSTDSNAEKLTNTDEKLKPQRPNGPRMMKGLTSFEDAASFSLVMVSPIVPPWGPEKSFRVNFHSRERADSTKGTFKGLRNTSSTMMGSVMNKQKVESQGIVTWPTVLFVHILKCSSSS